MSWAAIAVGAVSLGYGIYSSEHKKNQAKKLAAKNVRPVYQVQEPIVNNQYSAENNAQQGLTDSSKELFTENADRALSSSLDALLKSGGGLNSVSELNAQYGNNLEGLAGLDNEWRFKNQQILAAQNERMAQEKDKEFQINDWGVYADQAQRIAELRSQANADMQAGISGATGAVGNAAGNMRQRPAKKTRVDKPIDTFDVETPNGIEQGISVPETNNQKYGWGSGTDNNYLLDNLYSGNKWD